MGGLVAAHRVGRNWTGIRVAVGARGRLLLGAGEPLFEFDPEPQEDRDWRQEPARVPEHAG